MRIFTGLYMNVVYCFSNISRCRFCKTRLQKRRMARRCLAIRDRADGQVYLFQNQVELPTTPTVPTAAGNSQLVPFDQQMDAIIVPQSTSQQVHRMSTHGVSATTLLHMLSKNVRNNSYVSVYIFFLTTLEPFFVGTIVSFPSFLLIIGSVFTLFC